MKNGMKITAAILVIALVAAMICTGLELKKTKAQLTATELSIKMLSEMAQMKETELNNELTKVRAECIRMMMEKEQKTGKKWVPQWTGGGILKPIEPKKPLEVLK